MDIKDVEEDFNRSLIEIDLSPKEKAKANFIKEKIVPIMLIIILMLL